MLLLSISFKRSSSLSHSQKNSFVLRLSRRIKTLTGSCMATEWSAVVGMSDWDQPERLWGMDSSMGSFSWWPGGGTATGGLSSQRRSLLPSVNGSGSEPHETPGVYSLRTSGSAPTQQTTLGKNTTQIKTLFQQWHIKHHQFKTHCHKILIKLNKQIFILKVVRMNLRSASSLAAQHLQRVYNVHVTHQTWFLWDSPR